MELTDTMREITMQVGRSLPEGQRSRAIPKVSEIYLSSSSEEEFIQKMKEAFPEAFQK